MERKEPTLSKIVPDKDEVAPRQERTQRRPERPPTAPPPSGRPPTGASSGLVVAALVLAFIGLAGSGFLAWQFYEAEQNLTQSEARIADLERRLDITYDESADSLEAIQAKLQWADSEIRKLWGVSYDTNRRNIATNTEQLEKLNQSLGTIRTDLNTVKTDSGSAKSALAELESSLSGIRSSVSSLESGMGSLNDQNRRLQDLQEKLDQFNDRMTELSGLTNRVSSNEEAIEAIDAYRRSINRDIISLKEQLGQ